MIFAKGIKKSYGSLDVLKSVDVTINKGEIVSIVGASGAGKSTLLHILGTLDTADAGELMIDNTSISQLSASKLAAFRNKHIGFVFPEVSYYIGKSDGDKIIKDDTDLCLYLLDKAHVALVPGSAFGGVNYIRFSYACSKDDLTESVKRIKKALEQLK